MSDKYDGFPRPDKPAEREPPEVMPPGKNKRKDLKRFCRGNPNRPHKIAVVEPRTGRECRRSQWGRREWICRHRRQCTQCGKVDAEGWDFKLSECTLWDGQPFRLGPAE